MVLSDKRYGISTAVTYQDKVYIVDLGHGSHMRLLSAGFGSDAFDGTSMAKIRGSSSPTCTATTSWNDRPSTPRHP